MSTSEISKPQKSPKELQIDECTKKLERIKTALLIAAEAARRNKKKARTVSVITGILIALIGITLAKISTSGIVVPGTTLLLREALSYISALLGAIVTFVNERFDPAKLREKEVALGDVIYQFGRLEETLKHQPIISMTDKQFQKILDDFYKDENTLLEKAEAWKAGIRANREAKNPDE